MQALGSSLSEYRDRRFPGSDEEYFERLRTSTTVYVGNLSFQTTEFQMYEVRQPAAMQWRSCNGMCLAEWPAPCWLLMQCCYAPSQLYCTLLALEVADCLTCTPCSAVAACAVLMCRAR